MGITCPIGNLKSPIGDIITDWGLLICSLIRELTDKMPNWRLGIRDWRLVIVKKILIGWFRLEYIGIDLNKLK